MNEREENEKVMGVEPSTIEIEAEEAGVPVADFFVKELNSMQNPDYYQTVMKDVKADVESDGLEYRITANFPEHQLSDDEIQQLLRFKAKHGADMWIAIASEDRLKAEFLWVRPTKNARHGEEKNQGR